MDSHSTETALNELIEMVPPQIELLPKGTAIRTKHLFEPYFWLGSTKGVRLELGHLVADLVRQNRLPLASIGKASNNHQQYIVI